MVDYKGNDKVAGAKAPALQETGKGNENHNMEFYLVKRGGENRI
jgi:hypothetical protein